MCCILFQQIVANNNNDKGGKYLCSGIRRSPCHPCWEGSRKRRSVAYGSCRRCRRSVAYGSCRRCRGRVLFFVQARQRFDPCHDRVRMLANFNQTSDASYYIRPGMIAAFILFTNLCQFEIPFRPFVGKGGLQKQSQH